MEIWYSAREVFNSDYEGWDSYISGSYLKHIKEVVSLDSILNGCLVEPDYNNERCWQSIVIRDLFETGFFTSLDFVLQYTKTANEYNLMAIVENPSIDCSTIEIDDFEFIGYDLLDKSYDISALTNCCEGFPETFSAKDTNEYGVIPDYELAKDIHYNLRKNNPNEYHADTNIFAIWRKYVAARDPESSSG